MNEVLLGVMAVVGIIIGFFIGSAVTKGKARKDAETDAEKRKAENAKREKEAEETQRVHEEALKDRDEQLAKKDEQIEKPYSDISTHGSEVLFIYQLVILSLPVFQHPVNQTQYESQQVVENKENKKSYQYSSITQFIHIQEGIRVFMRYCPSYKDENGIYKWKYQPTMNIPDFNFISFCKKQPVCKEDKRYEIMH